jgi:hypothetical protein
MASSLPQKEQEWSTRQDVDYSDIPHSIYQPGQTFTADLSSFDMNTFGLDGAGMTDLPFRPNPHTTGYDMSGNNWATPGFLDPSGPQGQGAGFNCDIDMSAMGRLYDETYNLSSADTSMMTSSDMASFSSPEVGDTSFSTLGDTSPSSCFGQFTYTTAPEAPMTPSYIVNREGKRVTSPIGDSLDRPSKRLEMTPRALPEQVIPDQWKANYDARNQAYSPSRPQRASKAADPQANRIPEIVPWKTEIVQNKKRKTKVFHGYTKNITQAREVDEAWRRAHSHGHPRVTTTPLDDATFPDLNTKAVDPQYLLLCSQIFYAICDWDNITEWTQVVEPPFRDQLLDEIYQSRLDAGHQGLKGASIDELRPSPSRLAKLIPDADTQHHRLMGSAFPEDYIIEQMASNLLDAAIQAQQGKLSVQPYSTADQG